MRAALLIPSLGGPHLAECLRNVAALQPQPDECVLVLSGGAPAPEAPGPCDVQRIDRRLGYTAAMNHGLRTLGGGHEAIAVLNDDAVPEPGWFGALIELLERRPDVAAVQGTVTDRDGSHVDGRGIIFDRWGLPIQRDRGQPCLEDRGERAVIAVSGTASAYRLRALSGIALANHEVFDESFDSYYEDLDVGLRLLRSGWGAVWRGGAQVRHLGSASGRGYPWRHPWWHLANRWRALAGNLSPAALVRSMPRCLRGEIRAVNSLARSNPRVAPIAAAVLASLPLLITRGWARATPGPRLDAIPEIPE